MILFALSILKDYFLFFYLLMFVFTIVTFVINLCQGFLGNWTKFYHFKNIVFGLFLTDNNKPFLYQVLEFSNRFTWQLFQQSLMYAVVQTFNICFEIESITHFGGATAIETKAARWGGISVGSYIFQCRGYRANPEDKLFQHEYGHYLQSQYAGIFYLLLWGLPSLWSAFRKNHDHNAFSIEQDCNVRAFRYFKQYVWNEKTDCWDLGFNAIQNHNFRLWFGWFW
jgi:hypothetical protein